MPKGFYERKYRPIFERFEQQYIPITECGCWVWLGRLNKENGYGTIFTDCRAASQSREYAHRYSWSVYRGEIPEGMHVLHTCDTPMCVNPDHLFLGTHLDNVRDMIRKNRQACAANGNHRGAKLTAAQVVAIRESKDTPTRLARQFGVSPSHACAIQRGRARQS